MGIFSWRSRQKTGVTILDDVIWLTKKAKFDGIARAVAENFEGPDAPVAIILAAHFPDSLDRLQKIVELADGPITAALVSELNAPPGSFDESHTIEIIVGERHPMSSRDDALLSIAGNFSCRSRIVYHLSLEDAFMKVFAGEWVMKTFRALGMKEDEAIKAHLVAQNQTDSTKN